MYDISVIVPFYNAEKYISSCVESLLAQTMKKIQIILINDGSTDHGEKIAQQYAEQYANVKLINKQNTGQGDSRNIGLQYAESKYVYFQDIDDFLTHNGLERLFQKAEDNDADIVLFNSVNVLETVRDEASLKDKDLLGGLYTHRSLSEQCVYRGEDFVCQCLETKEGFFPVVWVGLYQTEFLKKNKLLFEKILHEDNIWCMDTVLAAERIVCMNEILHYRRMVSTSVTHQKKTEKHVSGALRALEKSSEVYDRMVCDKRTKAAYKRWTLLTAGLSFYELMHSSKEVRKKYKKKYVKLLLSGFTKYNPQIIIKSIVKV